MEVCAHAVSSLASWGKVNKHKDISGFVNDVKLDVVASSAGDEGTDHSHPLWWLMMTHCLQSMLCKYFKYVDLYQC